MAVKYLAGIGLQSISIDNVDLTAAFGAGSEFAISIGNQGSPSIAWQTLITGTITSITVDLEASLDGTNWFVIDSSTSITGEIRSVAGSYRFIRINNSAVVGGAGDELTASFTYSNTTVLETLDKAGVPNFTEISITSAQVLASFTTPITIVPASATRLNIVKAVSCHKPASLYTVAGVTNFKLNYAGTSTIINFFSAGFLDQAGDLTQMQPQLAQLANEAFLNLDIVLSSGGANPGGSGSGVIVSVEYWPLIPGPMSGWR